MGLCTTAFFQDFCKGMEMRTISSMMALLNDSFREQMHHYLLMIEGRVGKEMPK